jgi:hypothetical protein
MKHSHRKRYHALWQDIAPMDINYLVTRVGLLWGQPTQIETKPAIAWVDIFLADCPVSSRLDGSRVVQVLADYA